MTRKRKHYGPVNKLIVPELDEEKYTDLMDIISSNIFKGNRSAVAKILGVSVPTVGRMLIRPPASGKQWWWNIVLRAIVQRLYEQLRDSHHKRDNKKAANVRTALDLMQERTLLDQLEWSDAEAEGCTQYLLGLLADSPTGTITTKELKKSGIANGYAPRTFRHAAKRLMLIKYKDGDDWTWRLPSVKGGDC